MSGLAPDLGMLFLGRMISGFCGAVGGVYDILSCLY